MQETARRRTHFRFEMNRRRDASVSITSSRYDHEPKSWFDAPAAAGRVGAHPSKPPGSAMSASWRSGRPHLRKRDSIARRVVRDPTVSKRLVQRYLDQLVAEYAGVDDGALADYIP